VVPIPFWTSNRTWVEDVRFKRLHWNSISQFILKYAPSLERKINFPPHASFPALFFVLSLKFAPQRSPFSHPQLRTAALTHGCDLTDVLATFSFTLLVKSLQWNRKIQCRSYCSQIFTSFELFGVAILFICCGNGVNTSLFSALHPCTWPLQPTVFKWRQNCPSTGFASWSRKDTMWTHCATLGPVMLINREFDISCKLDISLNLSTFPSQLHWKASWSFATQSRNHGVDLMGWAPPKQSSKPSPQI